MVFNNYAKYYNLLYKDKDYSTEAKYVHNVIGRFNKRKIKTVLDIGCGTGIHAQYMTSLGYQLTGIDLSQEMINQAVERKIPNADFKVGNATSFSFNKKFDAVTSLFHVLSYQTATKDAIAMMKNATAHLNDDGLFIFDFWYGPAVLTEKPSVKIKRLEDEELKVIRIAQPVLKVNDNVVDVNFELLVHDKIKDQLSVVNESHPMRYFFKPEIEMLLTSANLRALCFEEWQTGKSPSENTWGVCCVAGKMQNQ